VVSGNKLMKFLDAAGYKTMGDKQLPPPVRKDMGLKGKTSVLTEPAAEGIKAGLAELEEKLPALGKFIRENVPVAIVHRTDSRATGISATSVSNNFTGEQWLVVNSNTSSMDASVITDPNIGVPWREAMKHEGEDRVSNAWRATIFHEAGHIADVVANGRLTKDVVHAVVQQAGGAVEVSEYTPMGRTLAKFSQYGAAAGPQELAAEVFAAALLGHDMPKMFHPVRDRILRGEYNS
jgi:hypothetical protein